MDADETRRFWHALERARYDRPTQMRRQFALVGFAKMDLDHLFLEVITPQYVVEIVEDLVRERQLRRLQATRLEEKILETVDAQGQWKGTAL